MYDKFILKLINLTKEKWSFCQKKKRVIYQVKVYNKKKIIYDKYTIISSDLSIHHFQIAYEDKYYFIHSFCFSSCGYRYSSTSLSIML